MLSVEVIITWPAAAVAKYCDEYVCLCVCLSARISLESYPRSLLFLCMLPMSVARSSSGMLTIGRIACRREGGDGSAQRRRSVIYDCDCLVVICYSFVQIHSDHAYHQKQSAITCFKLNHMNRPIDLLIKQKQVLTAYNKAPFAMHARHCSNTSTASKTSFDG